MIGGSYDYLCFKAPDEILGHEETIERMANDLAELGYAADVAAATWDIILATRAFEVRLGAALDRIKPIWRAREWWQSGDTGEDDFKRQLEEYRK